MHNKSDYAKHQCIYIAPSINGPYLKDFPLFIDISSVFRKGFFPCSITSLQQLPSTTTICAFSRKSC